MASVSDSSHEEQQFAYESGSAYVAAEAVTVPSDSYLGLFPCAPFEVKSPTHVHPSTHHGTYSHHIPTTLVSTALVETVLKLSDTGKQKNQRPERWSSLHQSSNSSSPPSFSFFCFCFSKFVLFLPGIRLVSSMHARHVNHQIWTAIFPIPTC